MWASSDYADACVVWEFRGLMVHVGASDASNEGAMWMWMWLLVWCLFA
jgi:hypothetical protein